LLVTAAPTTAVAALSLAQRLLCVSAFTLAPAEEAVVAAAVCEVSEPAQAPRDEGAAFKGGGAGHPSGAFQDIR
jgi:hypothetical protein